MGTLMDVFETANDVKDGVEIVNSGSEFIEKKDAQSGLTFFGNIMGFLVDLILPGSSKITDKTTDKVKDQVNIGQRRANSLNYDEQGENILDKVENGGIYGTPKIEIPKNIQGNLNKNRPNFAINSYDPLVFDLNGDGKINLINSQTYFDYEGDGIKEAGYWLDKTDGFLAIDRNNNGSIDDASELFGNFTPINENNDFAKDGYEALAKFDTNNDGIIDANDTEFNNLQIWQDLNGDGISQENELKSLSELEIKSLNLNNFPNLNLLVA